MREYFKKSESDASKPGFYRPSKNCYNEAKSTPYIPCRSLCFHHLISNFIASLLVLHCYHCYHRQHCGLVVYAEVVNMYSCHSDISQLLTLLRALAE